jgi:hypothetical protein
MAHSLLRLTSLLTLIQVLPDQQRVLCSQVEVRSPVSLELVEEAVRLLLLV